MTDQYSGYNVLDGDNEKNFVRIKVDHSVTYSLGNGIHTKGIESFGQSLNEVSMASIIRCQ